ncbi:hypothetical protein C8Q80DRAFT_780259 [Daedaleopsis nitida]|nr:hypothetical protein C8Q80DRAFT_780259 [Daedaleopsis nitida]
MVSHPASSPIPAPNARVHMEAEAGRSLGLSNAFDRFAFRHQQPMNARQVQDASGMLGSGTNRRLDFGINQSPLSSFLPDYPPRHRNPSLSPPLSPPQQITRISGVKKKRDAYDAFGSPEANWSTVSTKKNRSALGNEIKRRTHETKARSSFKLPITLGSALSVKRTTDDDGETERQSEMPAGTRRVVTYIPPPPKHMMQDDRRLESSSRPQLSSPSRWQHQMKPKDASPPPSPPTFRPMAVRRAANPYMSLSSYRCPTATRTSMQQFSQPAPVHIPRERSSSPTLPASSDEWDGHSDTIIAFDTPTLARRYPVVRRGVGE